MHSHDLRPSARPIGPGGPVGRTLVGLLVGLALLLAPTVPAAADPDPTVPSRQQVRAAQAEVDRGAAAVASVRASLLLANRRLESAATEAEQAAERYNGALWRQQQAEAALAAARRAATRARHAVARQRDAIGALVAGSYQRADQLSAVSALAGASGPEAVLDQYAGFQGASTALEADYQRFAAIDALAGVFEQQALVAERHRREAAAAARAARTRAVAAAEEAQGVAASVAAEKDRLVRALADAQGVSVALASRRQTALEEIAREKAVAKAQRAAERAAREEPDEQRPVTSHRSGGGQGKPPSPRLPNAAPAPAPAPEPAPEPAPPPVNPPVNPPASPPAPPSPDAGAGRALAFARAQVGEPYRWGAAGPSAWDCSGLTMRAWREAGVFLPHYSVAQYHAASPVTLAGLRPGDLVFWSSGSSPSGIHHVALYAGDGMIVHAPRTGRPVTVESMYYWVPPTHFARP